MQTKINWFQIPSTDFDRAVRFYETIFDSKLRFERIGELPMGIFNAENGESIGCVVHGPQFVPSQSGPVLYLDATPSIDTVVARIGKAGGRVLIEKTELPNNIGFVAHFIDTEGNRLALHAQA
jgi:predicted enzyme related to lactoylglutathione lyase